MYFFIIPVFVKPYNQNKMLMINKTKFYHAKLSCSVIVHSKDYWYHFHVYRYLIAGVFLLKSFLQPIKSVYLRRVKILNKRK